MTTFRSTAPLALVCLAAFVPAQDPQIESVRVNEHLFMLVGNGGNIGLTVGESGPMIIDDQYAPMVPKIQAAVRVHTDEPVKFVLNTHWHGDHTGGNERFGEAGAVIVAHENVRKRMSMPRFIQELNREESSPPKALPVITITENVTFHWNGDEIRLFHVPSAHTDGDVVIWFVDSNVFHMGDTFFTNGYPYIDIGSGGTYKGLMAAADRVIALADDETKIIPGHGNLADKKRLQEYRAMLETVHERVSKLIDEGKTEAEVAGGHTGPDWIEGVQTGYPILRARGRQLQDAGVPFIDASMLFAEVNEELYYDACHFGVAGHERLADVVVNALLEALPD